jgi:hypothetical protein
MRQMRDAVAVIIRLVRARDDCAVSVDDDAVIGCSDGDEAVRDVAYPFVVVALKRINQLGVARDADGNDARHSFYFVDFVRDDVHRDADLFVHHAV